MCAAGDGRLSGARKRRLIYICRLSIRREEERREVEVSGKKDEENRIPLVSDELVWGKTDLRN